jgi:hypothetical protein
MRTPHWYVVAGLVVGSSLSACGGVKDYEPYATSDRTLFMPSVRSAAPEPVYSRARWFHPPDVMPQREMPGDDLRDNHPKGVKYIRPVFHVSLKNATLEETARVVAAMARYTSYTAPSIASRRFSIETLGTIDEVGAKITSKAGINVVIDHENREVRFLAPEAEAPKLLPES